MAKARSIFVCQNCGAITNRWQGRCDSCQEWNSIVQEIGEAAGPARSKRGRLVALENLSEQGEEAAAHRHGPRRIRSGRGRRFRPRIRHPARRGARDRQIDAAHPGLRCARPARRARGLYFRRGSARAGAASSAAPGSFGCADRSRLRHRRRGYSRNLLRGRTSCAHHHRLDPNHAEPDRRTLQPAR